MHDERDTVAWVIKTLGTVSIEGLIGTEEPWMDSSLVSDFEPGYFLSRTKKRRTSMDNSKNAGQSPQKS